MRVAGTNCKHRELPDDIRTPGDYLMAVNRNLLFLIIGALVVAVGVLSYNVYQDRKQPEGLQINVGPNGLKVQGK